MSGIANMLYDLYIRFLVWLGAEPPAGYEYLLPAAEAGPREYTLKAGDTLFAVARRFGVHYDIIAKANAIADPAGVKSGQTVIIPPANWNPETDAPFVQPPAETPPTPPLEIAETLPFTPPPAEEVEPFIEAEIKPTPTQPPAEVAEEAPSPPPEPHWLWPDETATETDQAIDEILVPEESPLVWPEAATPTPVHPPTEEIEAEDAVETPAEPSVPEAKPPVPVEPVAPQPEIEAMLAPVIEEEETVKEVPWIADVEAETPPAEGAFETVDSFDIETPAVAEDQELLFRYELQRGDTLSAIARRYGITVKALIEANNIIDPNRIYPGQKLVIPGYDQLPRPEPEPAEVEPQPKPQPPSAQFITHIVAKGDTLSGIAKRYGLTLRQLVEVNNIEDPGGSLRLGQHLLIPGVMQPPKVTPSPEPKPAPQLAPEAEVKVPSPPPPEPKPTPHSAPEAEVKVPSPPSSEPKPAPQLAPEPTAEIDPTFPPLGPLQTTRALYVSYFAIGHAETRQRIFDLLGTTELNALVIDVKSDHGLISYPTKNPTAQELGADHPTAKDFAEVMAHLKDHGIYTIARIVTLKDDLLAKGYPDLAVKTADNRVWQDHEQSGWADPFLKPVWDYNIQIAIEAARLRFDEIQFDYLRFPFSSQVGQPHFSQEVSKEVRIAAITGFLSIARGQLQPLGVKLGAKTFGYTCWRKDDSLIGQDIERMAEYLDVLSPMLAPSTFGSGIPGYKFAIAHPYEVVYESAKRAVERVSRFDCLVRPWIQDFPDYRFDKRAYGREEIQAQIKGCFDAGSVGFMVWSPKVQYTEDAYAPVQIMP